jgi:hypothetical protein
MPNSKAFMFGTSVNSEAHLSAIKTEVRVAQFWTAGRNFE